MLETPILFIVFNRPDHTKVVLERIREVKPKYLFVSADGPRPDRPGEAAKCEATRALVKSSIDWECSVKYLFREMNLGCARAVGSGITWFFENVEEGIILEDDCVPDKAFFDFSEALLKHYRNDSRVMHIGGGRYAPQSLIDSKNTYYFSKYAYCWGWASWRRAWAHYDFDLTDLNQFADSSFGWANAKKNEVEYWKKVLTDVKAGKIDTWNYRWNYSLWRKGGVAIHTTRNFIRNIGFDTSATHTVSENESYRDVGFEPPTNGIIHPKKTNIHYRADKYVFETFNLGRISKWQRIKNFLTRIWATSISSFGSKNTLH